MNGLITPELIAKYPTMSDTARTWISLIPKCKWIEDYFGWLNKQLCYLKPQHRKEVMKRLVSRDDNDYYEAIAEFVYMAFWNYLKWPFEKNPKIGKLTPDFKVNFDKKDNNSFLCDVTVVRHNHPHDTVVISGKTGNITINGKTIDRNTQKLPLVSKPIQQAHRFLMKVKDKLDKYRNILNNAPFVLCFYQYGFGNNFYLDDFQIRNALFGDLKVNFTTGEWMHQPSIHTTEHNQVVNQGIFGFEEYKILTAVIICREEFYPTSNVMLQEPKPHYPQKAKFSFSIYANPLGVWANKEKNPFSSSGLSVNGLADASNLEFCAPREIEFC